MPEPVANSTKLILVPSYFVNNETGYKLPKIFKRHTSETELIYKVRVKNMLLRINNENFLKVAELIDPEDPLQFCFFELYSEIAIERDSRQ